jgi:thioredoxin reductase (NADPH)
MEDVIIVGGGAAGLTAASYLGRFRRPCLVLDAGESRARWIPESHNMPGFPQGVAGAVLLEKFRAQALQYGARIEPTPVLDILDIPGSFWIRTERSVFLSRYVVLATGVKDQLPDIAGIADAVDRGILRICPVCDGYEAIGKRIAVIGDGARAEREADFLRTFSDRVTYVHVGATPDLERKQFLAASNIECIEVALSSLVFGQDALYVRTESGEERAFDTCYASFGCLIRNNLALKLGARCDDSGALIVDAHQQTSVDGLYAAGDMVRGLNQLIVAAAEAAVAATALHNRLRGRA